MPENDSKLETPMEFVAIGYDKENSVVSEYEFSGFINAEPLIAAIDNAKICGAIRIQLEILI